jgi:hypothetical protein
MLVASPCALHVHGERVKVRAATGKPSKLSPLTPTPLSIASAVR